MKIIIRTYEELIDFVNRDDISVDQAYEVTIEFTGPIIVFSNDPGYKTKEELIADILNYQEIERISPCRPMFLRQKDANFSIRQIYNTDENE